MNVREGMNVSTDNMLQICANIGSAMMAFACLWFVIQMNFTFRVGCFNTDTGVIYGNMKT